MFKKNIIFIFLIVSVFNNFIFAETEIKNDDNLWFKNAVFYQIFVGAFKDSDSDGYGDFNGLTSKLDYIKSLGVDAIYLNPIFESYQTDKFTRYNLGYEVIDLKKVNPKYGTLEDFKTLIAEAHKKNIKIILDFVTMGFAVQNKFFQDVRTNPNSPYKDWFILKKEIPKENWLSYGYPWTPIEIPTNKNQKEKIYFYSLFGASVLRNIKKDDFINAKINTDIDKLYSLLLKKRYIDKKNKNKKSDEVSYYYFTKNLKKDFSFLEDENLKLISEVFKNTEIKGELSGTVSLNYKNPEVVDYIVSASDYWLQLGIDGFRCDAAKYIVFNGGGKNLQEHQPETFDFWRKFKKNMLKYGDDKVLIGEIIPPPIEYDYIGKNRELFDILYDGVFAESIYDRAVFFKEMFAEGFNVQFDDKKIKKNNYLIYNSNHDKERIAGKLVNKNSISEKKLLASLLLLSNGTPMIYYGDEIGLTYGDSKNRTSCLSTMSFYGSKYSGFSNSKKIIPPLTLNRKTNTVEIQNKKSDSLLNHYRKVIELRHSYNVFANGFRKKHKQIDPKIYSYLLYNDEITVLVLHNLSDKPKDLVFNLENILPKENFSLKKILGDKLTSYKLEDKTLYLKKFKGHESLVFEITGITSKNFKEIEPDFDKAEAIKINEKYITQNTNAVYKLPTSNKFLGLKIKASSPHVLTFYNTLSDIIKTNHYIRNIVEINAVDKEIIIPLAFDASFFVFYMEGIEFELVELDMDDYFVKKTKEILKHDSNKTLKSFAYGSDNNFWYFKIQKNSLAMNPNSGLDFCMLINEPSKRKNTSPKKVGFWMLKNIQTKLPINNILIYQQDVGLKKPILYTNTTEASLPGVQHDLAIIFQENKNAFYIVMNKEALPLETYKIGLCVWSAGGAWGDRMPKQYPIVEMLPYNKKEMKKSNPNKLNLVKISDHARINKK